MVVSLIKVDVVNIIALGYRAIGRLPDMAVKIISFAISAAIIATFAKRISASIEYYKWQRGRSGTEGQLPSCKPFVDGLPTYAKRLGYFRATESLLIQLVHSICGFDIGFTTHIHSIQERVAGVNR